MGLILAGLLWLLAADQPPPSMYHLTVRMGSGSGWYACGAVVTINAPAWWLTLVSIDGGVNRPSASVTFDHWANAEGWDDLAFWAIARQAHASFPMPCQDLTVDPFYR